MSGPVGAGATSPVPGQSLMATRTETQRPQSQAEQTDRKQQVLTHGSASAVHGIADALVIKDRDLFFLCKPDGEVPVGADHGFGLYYNDCRLLRGYELRLDGDATDRLASSARGGKEMSVELTNREVQSGDAETLRKERLGITWRRHLDGETLTLSDTISLENYGAKQARFSLDLRFDARFEDTFEVRGLLNEHPGTLHEPTWKGGHLLFGYDGADGIARSLTIEFHPAPSRRNGTEVGWDMQLDRHAHSEVQVHIRAAVKGKPSDASDPRAVSGRSHKAGARRRRHGGKSPSGESFASVRSDSRLLEGILDRSIKDLGILRSDNAGAEYYAAGVPWFVALFGRDSVITSIETLAFDPTIAEQTIRVLASWQGTGTDDYREEQPGKILHELRVGELARIGAIPHHPFYGSVDSTPLFCLLVALHARWTGSLDLFHELQNHVEAALHWIDRFGDSDGDGFIDYRSSTGHGLVNQGWKDSGNGIVNADGSIIEPPVSLVEVQGYVFRAKTDLADLYERSGDERRARSLRREAERLRRRFEERFWLDGKKTYALALGKDGHPAAVVSSNPGQALWSGIVSPERAAMVRDSLMTEEMFSGWGVRTLSSSEVAYNPIGYHLGTVWPHDNALIAAGFRRYGFDREAHRIFEGIVDAAAQFPEYRLPEVFAGYDKSRFSIPVHYPVACHPQAWAAGSVPICCPRCWASKLTASPTGSGSAGPRCCHSSTGSKSTACRLGRRNAISDLSGRDRALPSRLCASTGSWKSSSSQRPSATPGRGTVVARRNARKRVPCCSGDEGASMNTRTVPTWTAPFTPTTASEVPDKLPSDVERLAIDLLNAIDGEVRFDPGSRALYSTDASNYRQVPIGVVVPRGPSDVIATVEICRAHDVPIVSRGGGTSLAGQTCNVAVVMDHSKYNNRLLELDAEHRRARVQPGLVLDELRDAAERHHLTYGPDPATHDHCTLGGMIGNNSCGVHSVMAGKTDDNVEELEVLTYDGTRLRVGKTGDDDLVRLCAEPGRTGEIYRRLRAFRDEYASEIRARFPEIPRRVSGYNLPMLLPEHGFDVAKALVGSESTLVTVLEATVRLVESPPGRTLVAVGYPDVYAAADDVTEVVASGCIACEGMDDKLVRDIRTRGLGHHALRLLPPGLGFLLVEFGGRDRRESDEKGRAFIESLRRRNPSAQARMYDDPADEEHLWKVRESGLGATAMVPGKAISGPGWEDSAVPPERLGDYLREIRKLWDRYGYDADMYGHFGQGVLHCRIDFDLVSARGLSDFRRYIDDASRLVVSMGGSLSGEHGDGQARGEVLPIMFGERLVHAFEEFKDIWDPQGMMNPGKLVRANPIVANLRLGSDYDPPRPKTFFRYPSDAGSFAHAAFRCVGVGECRKHEGGVMCPSYQVTREEKHSTRGRARLLFEMMNGKELKGGWRNKEVAEALDLCLACKGCKGDCPVNVDMATYKAEFRAHHYAHRLRPITGYSMGLIHWWAKLAAHAPGLVNAVAHAPMLSRAVKRMGGIAPERDVPRFAPQTFRARWAKEHGEWTGQEGRFRNREDQPLTRQVILWADTFNDNFHPDVLQAAAEVLEDAGCEVIVPKETLCCGRPLYDFGFLSQARHLLRNVLGELRPEIQAGVPIVGLEPSCVSVFRDEAPNLLAGDMDARRISTQTYTLTEYLSKLKGYRPPELHGKAIVQGHCHHKSVLDFDAELDLFRKMGLEIDTPEASCCGMAGAFGFERGEHYRVAMAAGERALLPAVRAASPNTYIVAGGFSCREQIEQGTDRSVLHPAELMAMAIHRAGPRRQPAEQAVGLAPGEEVASAPLDVVGSKSGRIN